MTQYKYSTQSVSKLLQENGYNLIKGERYFSIKKKLNIIDEEGYKYYISLDAFIAGNRFHKFFVGNKFSIENMRLWLLKNNKDFSLISNEYTGSRDRNLLFSCSVCGYVWITSWNDASNDHGCPTCMIKNRSIKRRLSFGKIIKIFQENNMSIIDPSSYVDTETPVFCRCNKCGYEWNTDYHHVRRDRGCPKCSSSHGEKRIQKFLDENLILYEIQKRFDGCAYKKHLPFDFYLPYKNICIEYHGIQHYQPIEYFGGKEKHETMKIRDGIKRNFCIDNNIRFLEISYLDYDNVENIIYDFI